MYTNTNKKVVKNSKKGMSKITIAQQLSKMVLSPSKPRREAQIINTN